jgi:hypothetical protein
VVDLVVIGGPIHAVEARRIGRIVDIDLRRGEAHVLNFFDARHRLLIAGDHLARAGIAIHADPVAHLAAQQLVHRQPGRLAGDIPKRRLDGRQGGDVLPALRAGEYAGGTDPFEGRLHIQRVLPYQQPRERPYEGHVALRSVGGFSLPDDSLVGVHAHVDLVAVDAHLRGTNFRNFEFRPPVRCVGVL